MRDFVGIGGTQPIPDRVSILRFRRLLVEHDLSLKLLKVIDAKHTAHGLLLKIGEHDPEMHKTKKVNQWHFGMKAHIGTDADSGLVHTVIGTAANANNVTTVTHCCGEEQVVFADAGYQGASKRDEASGVDWQIAIRLGKRKQQRLTPWGALTEQAEKLKAGVQVKLEHPFRVIKRQCGHGKARCRGLA